MPDPLTTVADLLRRTAEEVVLPLFRSEAADPRQKRPGDWVTAADLNAEHVLTQRLLQVLPGSAVVGEEAVHADPSLMQRLHGTGQVWLIDPVDGTRNYAAGREPFAMIVALVRDGAVSHGWVYLPMEDRMLTAAAGSGAMLDGRRLLAPQRMPARLRGIVPLPVLKPDAVADIEARSPAVADLLPSWWCSGREHPDVAEGAADFAVFTTSMPWDHAAGSLAIAELGGRAAYFDGEPYTVRDESRRSLLIARSPEIWDKVRWELLPAIGADPEGVWTRR